MIVSEWRYDETSTSRDWNRAAYLKQPMDDGAGQWQRELWKIKKMGLPVSLFYPTNPLSFKEQRIRLRGGPGSRILSLGEAIKLADAEA